MSQTSLRARRAVRLAPVLILVSAALSLAPDAGAVVEQIDGRVMPLFNAGTCPSNGDPTSCVQVALNRGEGFADTATNNPLNAVNDAQTTPEVFAIPQTGGVFGSVTVYDMVEGAGYENTFGWYNVDDPDTLYPIMGCAVEPPQSRTVDFQAEFDADRYAGGFIGFYLTTPENQPTNTNCGAAGNEGHVYYTEAARNGDGNYVHYLIYTSKQDPERFYFGFEDKFRGNDNDFEDMFLRVDGLVLPCSPTSEVCDGEDNNCDGLVDNNPVDAGGPCGLTDVGECELGVYECNDGDLECVGEVGPTDEICDGLDNDCDQTIDNEPEGEGDACGTDEGECEYGQRTCVGGFFVCVGGTGPAAEVCDLLDNDCDGTPDDDPLDAGGACGTNIGECEPGVRVCNEEGEVECVGGTGPTDEVCDGLDNDCDGAVDEGNPGGGAACGEEEGQCEPGVEVCVGGEIVCVGGVGPSEEVCDGIDNDCNGDGDALAECPNGSQCVEGSCAAPCGDGEFPCPGGQVCVGGFCLEGSCDDVECDEGEVCQSGVCVPESSGEGGAGATTSSAESSTSTAAGVTGSTVASSGAGPGDGDGDGGGSTSDNYGLATGGSGLRCATATVGAGARGAGAVATLAALGLALAARRRRVVALRGEVKR